MALADFRHITRFLVPFRDVDMMQHAHHAAYVVWAENARSAYFADVLGDSFGGSNGIILARLEFDYERPLEYREDVAVGCRVGRMGRKSFDFVYEIWSETHRQRAAHGMTTVVAYDYERKVSIEIPERWRELIAAYEAVAPILGT
jgi:acyl-CoA thioester hydrolase